MVAAIRQTVTVGPGGRIEIPASDLRPGDQAEVIVLVEQGVASAALTPLQALKALRASLALTPEAAQKWIDEVRAERQAWGNRG